MRAFSQRCPGSQNPPPSILSPLCATNASTNSPMCSFDTRPRSRRATLWRSPRTRWRCRWSRRRLRRCCGRAGIRSGHRAARGSTGFCSSMAPTSNSDTARSWTSIASPRLMSRSGSGRRPTPSRWAASTRSASLPTSRRGSRGSRCLWSGPREAPSPAACAGSVRCIRPTATRRTRRCRSRPTRTLFSRRGFCIFPIRSRRGMPSTRGRKRSSRISRARSRCSSPSRRTTGMMAQTFASMFLRPHG